MANEKGTPEYNDADEPETQAALCEGHAAWPTQFTPGPWRVSSTGFSVKSSDDKMPIVAQNPWGSAMVEPKAEAWLANADLIAAAPEMYALLKRVLPLGDRGLFAALTVDLHESERKTLRALIDDARSILAAVEGR